MHTARTVARQLKPFHPARRSYTLALNRNLVHKIPLLPVPSTRQRGSLTATLPITRRYNSSDASNTHTSFPDLQRPDLVYRLCDPPTPASKTLPAYALSFLTEGPQITSPATDIGWLVRDEDHKSATDPKQNHGAFVPNPMFVCLLHGVIKTVLEEGVDDILKATAIQTMDGWMHINDQRNIPALNRIGDPEDIIGTVFVENGNIIPETYQPMPAYRLLAADGFMQLTPVLTKKLKETLSDIGEIERSVTRGRQWG